MKGHRLEEILVVQGPQWQCPKFNPYPANVEYRVS
jgi:hypothetical protein